jgi:HD-GYP domain-containing protein (c-di-GMP phosphodiesterase class II)
MLLTETSIHAFGTELEDRGLEPPGHTSRLVRLVESMGLMLGRDSESLEVLIQSAYLHDVGKLVLPERILLKASTLDPAEWAVVRTHTRWSVEIARAIPSVKPGTLETILHHHERWDGGGYPNGLTGTEIPFEARLLAVCDVYDTLLSKRPYSRAWTAQATLEEIQIRSGKHFDPYIVELFLERALGKLTVTG